LADGSVVELNRDGKIETTFTPSERRVRLVRGEALFTVTKNPSRPFVVEAGPVSVRAIGTAFDVRRADTSIDVLVTEGTVHVERPVGSSGAAPAPTPVTAGQLATVNTAAAGFPVVVSGVVKAQIESALAWQGVRLELADLPLSEVIAEFNLRNRQQILIGDPAIAGLLVGGNFRADNLESFVRLLEQSFGVAAERRDDGTIVLRRAK
jgi:transmembrane sensor